MNAAEALKELSEPWTRGGRIKTAIDRAARRSGLAYWRAFDIWYGKARRVEQFEIDAIQEALDKKRKEEARRELHELKTRIAKLEAALAVRDPNFHSADIDALRFSVRGGR